MRASLSRIVGYVFNGELKLFTPAARRLHLHRNTPQQQRCCYATTKTDAASDEATASSDGATGDQAAAARVPAAFRPKLIVFDKYGTLVDFHSTWSPWLRSFAAKLEAETGLDLKHRLFDELDVCTFTHKTRHGVLAQGTSRSVKSKITGMLVSAGLPRQEAQMLVERHWGNSGLEHTAPVHEDLEDLFRLLKQRGVKIAVSTTSTREHTIRSMKKIKLMPFIDKILCAEDMQNEQSNRNHIESLMSEFHVQPKDTVVVGDTVDDVRAGLQAEVAMTIGVLSGTGTRLDLAPYTHYIVPSVVDMVPLVFPSREGAGAAPREEGQHRPVITRVDPRGHRKASLVIFDKDGTLLCFHSMWTPWITQLMERLEQETGLQLQEAVLKEIGFCNKTGTWTPGLFAEGTQRQNQDVVVDHLLRGGFSEDNAQKLVDAAWSEAHDNLEEKTVKPLDNPTNLFRILKQFGVKIAICTADSRGSTEGFIESLGVSDCVDMIVCGDDDNTEPKPSPHNALKICQALGVDPAEAIHVGDTTADIGMGVTAGLGATVGVLSGVGDVDTLDKGGADHIVPSIKHVLSIALNEEAEEVREALQTHQRSETSTERKSSPPGTGSPGLGGNEALREREAQ